MIINIIFHVLIRQAVKRKRIHLINFAATWVLLQSTKPIFEIEHHCNCHFAFNLSNSNYFSMIIVFLNDTIIKLEVPFWVGGDGSLESVILCLPKSLPPSTLCLGLPTIDQRSDIAYAGSDTEIMASNSWSNINDNFQRLTSVPIFNWEILLMLGLIQKL